MSAVLLAAAILTALLGCVCLALSQVRHWKSVTGEARQDLLPQRAAGWTLIATSLALCVARDGGSFAALMWPLLLASGSLVTTVLMTWRPVALRGLARLLASIQVRGD